MSIDRTSALTELADPGTSAARLMEIAQAHPELGPQIVAHPNVYPGLVEWVAAYGTPAPAAPAADAPAATPPAVASSASGSRLGLLVGLIATGAVVLVGAIVAAVVFLPGLLATTAQTPATEENGPPPDAEVAAGSYRYGATVTWRIDGLTRSAPIVSDLGDVWLAQWGEYPEAHYAAVDAATGESLWTLDAQPFVCGGAIGDTAYCAWREYAEVSSHTLHVLDPHTGEVLSSPLEDERADTVAVVGDDVVIGVATSVSDTLHFRYERWRTDGTKVWSAELLCPDYHQSAPDAHVALRDGHLVTSGNCFSGLVDPATGAVLAQSGDPFAYDTAYPSIPVEGGVIRAEGDEVVVWDRDPESSAATVLQSVPLPDAEGNVAAVRMGQDAAPPLAVVGVLDGSLTRIDPATAPDRVDSMPRELPDCPRDWTPVAWSEWRGGATLVCRTGDAKLAVVIIDGKDVTWSTSAEATPAGYHALFGDTTVDIDFGGWIVRVGGDATVATTGWSAAHGQSDFPAVDGIEPCPSGSFPLSLSVWQGGWLLTCGISGEAATSFIYRDGSSTHSGGSLTAANGLSCGTANGLEVCVSRSPALVEFRDGPDTTQHSVTTNYFAGSGAGGAGEGTGAYGVDTPDATASAQVGYLVAILEKSASARSTVNAVLAPLNSCSVSSSDVQALRNLTKARTDLLNALQSTPVDQVPDGSHLLSLLKTALELSEQADQGYVDAATTMSGGDCSAGKTTYSSAIAVADQAEAAKQAFVDAWNASVPGQFGVRTFTAKDI